jgi:hypothetical protein
MKIGTEPDQKETFPSHPAPRPALPIPQKRHPEIVSRITFSSCGEQQTPIIRSRWTGARQSPANGFSSSR